MEPHMSSPSPCCYLKIKGKNENAIDVNNENDRCKIIRQVRSFTSFQMFHTHASLPRGCFSATA